MKIEISSELGTGLHTLVAQSQSPQLGATFSLLKLDAGQQFASETSNDEYVVVPYQGSASCLANEIEFPLSRSCPYESSAQVLNLPHGCSFCITALSACELLLVSTDNSQCFEPRLFDAKGTVVGKDLLEGRTMREKRPFWMRRDFPQTNLFCGELIVHQGSWACYPPHQHAEPEIYFYRFSPQGGYALVEDGEEVHRIEQNDIVGVTDFHNHSQAIAPGFTGYIFWIQRLQNNGKDIDYIMDTRYSWLDG